MDNLIRSPKDLAAGLFYIALGGAGILIATGYNVGSSSRMGPAYFPSLLGGGLVLIGLVALLRSLIIAGEPLEPVAWRPLLIITLSVILFALLLPRLGLAAALAVLIGVAAFASRQARLSFVGVLSAATLIAFCALVFFKGLGLPVPLIGPWLGG